MNLVFGGLIFNEEVWNDWNWVGLGDVLEDNLCIHQEMLSPI